MYKYFSVDEYSFLNLENEQLYLQHYSCFNDPFENPCKILYGFPKLTDRSDRLLNVLKAWGFNSPDNALVVETYQEYVESIEGLELCVRYIEERARIGCFSRDPLSLMMWTDYADGLRGFCVEFDRDAIVPEDHDAGVYDVLYRGAPSVIDASVLAVLYDQKDYNEEASCEVGAVSKHLGEDRSAEISLYDQGYKKACDGIEKVFQKMLATKPLSRSREQEIRIIDFARREDGLGIFMKYPKNSVKSLIVGERISRAHEVRLIALAKALYPGISLKKAVRVPGTFDLTLIEF